MPRIANPPKNGTSASTTSVGELVFNEHCRECTLADHLDTVRARKPSYWCKPVPPFGDWSAPLLIVGLAPGEDGANRTGRPFTGDQCSDFLYNALHRAGFGSLPRSISRDDSLTLSHCRITNAVKCLPPKNKPTAAQAAACNHYLLAELKQYPPQGILALGQVAHDAVLKTFGLKKADYPFGKSVHHLLPNGLHLWDSFHVSPLNTRTGRLSAGEFDGLLNTIKAKLKIG